MVVIIEIYFTRAFKIVKLYSDMVLQFTNLQTTFYITECFYFVKAFHCKFGRSNENILKNFQWSGDTNNGEEQKADIHDMHFDIIIIFPIIL